MSVAAPFRRTIEDIAENLADVIIIIIAIIIFYALITIGTKLWSGLQGLFAGIQGLGGLGGGGAAVQTPISSSPGGYTLLGGVTSYPTPGQVITEPSGQSYVTVIGGKGMNYAYPTARAQPAQAWQPTNLNIIGQPSVVSYPQQVLGPYLSPSIQSYPVYPVPTQPYSIPSGMISPAPSIAATRGVAPRGATLAIGVT
jgi:hypothetical protein